MLLISHDFGSRILDQGKIHSSSIIDLKKLVLTTEVNPGDVENLKEWQGGDIVVYGSPLPHIAIISDKRRRDGVPYIIHNGGPYAKEEDKLLSWPSEIIYHFRFPKAE